VGSAVNILPANRSLEPECSESKRAGDKVMVGSNAGLVYEIVHVSEPTAWIRPLGGGEGAITRVALLRKIEACEELEEVTPETPHVAA
jgi:hypothetical protein